MDANSSVPVSEKPSDATTEAPITTPPAFGSTAGIPQTAPMANPPQAFTQQMTQTQPSIISPSEKTTKSHSSWMLYILIALVFIVLLAGGAYLLLSRNSTSPQVSQVIPTSVPLTPTIAASPTPAISPITPQNADQSLNNTNSSIDQSVQQANQDLNSLNQIDSTQDNTNSVQ